MNRTELQREYDLIMSLGFNCQAAYQLKRKNLRSFSGPVDWMFTHSVSSLNKFLINKFEGFMELENLEVKAIQGQNKHFTVVDHKNLCISVHDFPIERESPQPLITYPEYQEKMNRRISRFYERLAKSQSSLFVRTQATRKEAMEMESALSVICTGDFSLLIVNYTTEQTIIEQDWGLTRVCSVEIPNTPGRWMGSDDAWDSILDGVKLC